MLGREARRVMMEALDLPEVSVPMPWHAGLWQRVHEQIAQQRLPHAMLLTGIADTGKERFAVALARLLLCRDPTAGHNCGSCHACQMSRVGSHGDFRWLKPEGKSRAIKVDQIRQAVDFDTKTAAFGSRKLLIFSPAENMNANAANALLKSLEEPSRGTYLLLVCHRLHGLPATIRSRCQLLRLPSPDPVQSLDWLDHLTGTRADSEQLLDLAQGRPLLAEKFYRGTEGEAAAAISQALDALREGRGTVSQVSAVLGELGIEGALGQLANYIQRTIRSAGQARELGVELRGYFLLLDEVNRLHGAVGSGANPNPQLLLDSLLARLQSTF